MEPSSPKPFEGYEPDSYYNVESYDKIDNHDCHENLIKFNKGATRQMEFEEILEKSSQYQQFMLDISSNIVYKWMPETSSNQIPSHDIRNFIKKTDESLSAEAMLSMTYSKDVEQF
jgi:hypothetical protein